MNMETRSIVAGITLVLLGMSFPANAYHSAGAGIDPRGGTSYDWTNAIPFLVICESDGPADTRNDLPTPKMGDGGLCAAGLKGAAVPSSTPASTVITTHVLTGTTAYTIQAGSWTCSTTTGETGAAYELYLYWNSDVGHVALFNDDPAAPGGSSTSSGGGTGTIMCNGVPAPVGFLVP